MNKFRDMKIGIKLFTSFALILVLLSLTGFIGLTSLKEINKTLSMKDTMIKVRYLLKSEDLEMMDLLQSEDLDEAGIKLSKMEKNISHFDSLADTLLKDDKINKSGGLKKDILDVKNSYNEKFGNIKTVCTDCHSINTETEVSQEQEKAYLYDLWKKQHIGMGEENLENPEIENMEKKFKNVSSLIHSNMDTIENIADKEMKKAMSSAKVMIIGFWFGGIVLGIFLAYFITVMITGPLNKLKNTFKKVEEGNLEATIDNKLLEQKDELGELARGFKNLTGSLHAIILEIYTNSKRLINASQKLTDVSNELAVQSEEMAEQTFSVSAGAEEMDHNMNFVAETAEELNNHLIPAATAAEEMTASIVEVSRNTSEAASVASDASSEFSHTKPFGYSMGF